MASQSMARMSSTSTDSDFAPGTVPFKWEDAPGRPAAVEIEAVASPPLPLPPGRRPKDGFFLTISRPAQVPNVEGSSHGEKKPFKLQYLKPSKKSSFRSRKSQKNDADVEDTGSIFNPLSANRFGSRVTKKVLVESQRSSSCFGLCWKESSSHDDHHRGKRLDSDKNDRYVTPDSSAASGSSLSSPRDGQTSNSLIDGAGKRIQTPSSRFMASMLLSLFPESDESGYGEADDGGPGIHGDKVRLSEPLTSPTTPASTSDEVRISEDLPTLRAPVLNSCRTGKLLGSDDSSNRSDERHSAADAHSVTGSPGRELRLRTKEESSVSTLSWKSSDQNKEELDPLAALVTANVSEPEFANERSDGEEDIERRASCSSLARNLSSVELSTASDMDPVLPGPTARNMIQSLSMPRSSVGSSDCPFVTSCSVDNPKADITRWRSSATPTAERPPLRRNPFGEPYARPISSPPHSPLQNQARLQIVTTKAFKIDVKVPISPPWLEELKTSSLWPHRAHGDADNGDSSGESGDDSEGSSSHSFEYHTPKAGSSTASPHSASSTSPKPAPVLCNSSTPPKPATWVVSKEVLKSSSLLQRKLQRQESYEASRSSFTLDQEITTVTSSSTALEQNDATATTVLTCAPGKVSTSDQASEGGNLPVLPTSGLSETSKSGSGEMDKAAPGESKAAVGSSGRSFPIYPYYH